MGGMRGAGLPDVPWARPQGAVGEGRGGGGGGGGHALRALTTRMDGLQLHTHRTG